MKRAQLKPTGFVDSEKRFREHLAFEADWDVTGFVTDEGIIASIYDRELRKMKEAMKMEDLTKLVFHYFVEQINAELGPYGIGQPEFFDPRRLDEREVMFHKLMAKGVNPDTSPLLRPATLLTTIYFGGRFMLYMRAEPNFVDGKLLKVNILLGNRHSTLNHWIVGLEAEMQAAKSGVEGSVPSKDEKSIKPAPTDDPQSIKDIEPDKAPVATPVTKKIQSLQPLPGSAPSREHEIPFDNPYQLYRYSSPMGKLLAEAIADPAYEWTLLETEPFYGQDEEDIDWTEIHGLYFGLFKLLVEEITRYLGPPDYRGQCNKDAWDRWNHLFHDYIPSANHVAVWDREGNPFYCRFSWEDKECPIVIAVGCQQSQPGDIRPVDA
jgi:hypothetical protein